MKAIRKYKNNKLQITESFSSDISNSDNGTMLSIMVFLLDDFFANGLYVDDIVKESDTHIGEILWEKTINNYTPDISSDSPIYLNLLMRRRIRSKESFFSKLHAAIISSCSRTLSDYGILSIFDYSNADISDLNISDLGDEAQK